MVSFDSTAVGTSASEWRAAFARHRFRQLNLADVSELLVFAAHPDDETLAAGGLIAEMCSRELPVHVVIVTDGAASHPDSITHSAEQLATIRAKEAFTAVAALAPGASISLLGFPDGAVLENRDAVAAALDPFLAESDDNALVLAPWRGDGHRDHRVVGEIVADATAEKRAFLEYPVWLWHWADPESDDVPWDQLFAVPMRQKAQTAKRRAILSYASQTTALGELEGDEAVLGAEFLRNFEHPLELFIGSER